MANKDKGFGTMNADRQREIASMGGKKAHAIGTAHEWNSTDAAIAGRKGGLASAANKKARAEINDEIASGIDVGADVPGGGAV